MTGIDTILGDLAPEVDPRFIKNRQGNPMEQTLAVKRGELTENEILDIVHKAGVSEKFADLPVRLKTLVEDGLAGLWKIDRLGFSVEDKDKKIVGGVEIMQKVVEEDLEEIRKSHRGGAFQWFPESVRCLVVAATDTDEDERIRHKDGAMGVADNYIRKLVQVGYDYRERTSNINETPERDRVNKYLGTDGERERDILAMKNILFQKVGPITAAIKPFPKE